MKQVLLMIAVVVLVGCASTPTMKSVAGTFEGTTERETIRIVLLNNGQMKAYENGGKIDLPLKWRITDGEVVLSSGGWTADFEDDMFLLIERNGNLTLVAEGINGVRKNLPKEERVTFNKIN